MKDQEQDAVCRSLSDKQDDLRKQKERLEQEKTELLLKLKKATSMQAQNVPIKNHQPKRVYIPSRPSSTPPSNFGAPPPNGRSWQSYSRQSPMSQLPPINQHISSPIKPVPQSPYANGRKRKRPWSESQYPGPPLQDDHWGGNNNWNDRHPPKRRRHV